MADEIFVRGRAALADGMSLAAMKRLEKLGLLEIMKAPPRRADMPREQELRCRGCNRTPAETGTPVSEQATAYTCLMGAAAGHQTDPALSSLVNQRE
jgi:hypothetical protein